MAEVQMVQLRGQAASVSSKAKTGSQFDFSGMLKEVSQSASEKKESVRSTEDESVKSANREPVQESEQDNRQITDPKDKTMTEDSEAAEMPAGLTGEEIAQLAGMMNALFQNPQGCAEQQEDLLGASEQELLVGELAGVAEEAGELSMDAMATDGTQAGSNELAAVMTGNSEDGAEALTDIEESFGLADQGHVAESAQTEETAQSEIHADGLKEASRQEGLQNADMQAVEQPAEQIASAVDSQPMQTISSMPEQTGTSVLKTSPDTLPEDLSKTITTNMLSKQPINTLEVTLEPATLGKITIKLIYEEGRAALSLISDNPKTLELLSQKVGDIAQILQEKTGQDTVVYTPETSYAEDDAANREHGGRQQEHKEQSKQEQTESFMQQLRLGLI